MDSRFHIVQLCVQYGMTYADYLNSPNWFIEMLELKHEADAKHEAEERRKMEAEARRIRRG